MIELSTLKKFERIVSIFFLLQSKSIVRGQEMAEKYQVSLRTIYRDIHTLQIAGVPIIGEPGAGYSIMQGYKLPPILFSNEEVLSFAAVEKLAEKHLDQSLMYHFSKANDKIKNVFKYQDKVQFENLSQNITIHQPDSKFNKNLPNGLSIIFKSITDKKQLQLIYLKNNDIDSIKRCIEPLGVFLKNRCWYVYAFCTLRNDYRHFRVDRIQSASLTINDFSLQHHDVKNDFVICDQPIYNVSIQVPKKFAFLLDGDKLEFGFRSEELMGDLITMYFDVFDIYQAFPRWLMMYADVVTIIEPLELKQNFEKLLNSIQLKQQVVKVS